MSTEVSLEIVDIVSRYFVILRAVVQPWYYHRDQAIQPANIAFCVLIQLGVSPQAHFQSFLMSKDHLNCRWVWLSSSTNLETAS